jgi:hypothetical protein
MRLLLQFSATYLRSTAATSAIFNPAISYFLFRHAVSKIPLGATLGENIFLDN